MGGGMAKNLLEKGEKVIAFDVDMANLAAIKALGAETASSPAEVAAAASRIVTMLPNNAAVKEVYTGSSGILGAVMPDALLIDSSTVDPAVSKEMAERSMKANKAVFVDAPVSGGVNAASAGTLTFMVGAADGAHYDRAKAVLEMMGANITHCGDVGTGQVVKICNNMLLAISMIGVSEAMNLGIK
jgi:3-hydroxyisobutyrate dehydrogenase